MIDKRLASSRTDPGTILVFPLVLLLLSGCVSAEKLQYPPETLRDAIRHGDVVQPGDRVAVTSADGGEQVLVVTEIDDDTIRGADAEVAIDEVTALEKRESSPVQTALACVAVWTVALATSAFLGVP